MHFAQVMTLHIVRHVFSIMLTSPAYFWVCGEHNLLGLKSILVRRYV